MTKNGENGVFAVGNKYEKNYFFSLLFLLYFLLNTSFESKMYVCWWNGIQHFRHKLTLQVVHRMTPNSVSVPAHRCNEHLAFFLASPGIWGLSWFNLILKLPLGFNELSVTCRHLRDVGTKSGVTLEPCDNEEIADALSLYSVFLFLFIPESSTP